MLGIGFGLAAVVAGLAWLAGSLSADGALAAVLVGGLLFGLGGWPWAALLLAFFITSSGLSRAFKARKRMTGEKYAKGSRRDAGQVLANGGLAALLVLAHTLWPEALWPWAAAAAALAAVNADTWGTELGALNPAPPRLVTDWRRVVEPGTSGGVSPLGTLAALSGAALLGLLAAIFRPAGADALGLFVTVTLAGMAGAFFDSWLGATVQAMYWCDACQKETEQHPRHRCGTVTRQVRGWRWLQNDWVNVACSLLAAGLAALWYF